MSGHAGEFCAEKKATAIYWEKSLLATLHFRSSLKQGKGKEHTKHMALQDELELNGLGKYAGGANAPTGTFLNIRTLAYFQQASDGLLPADGNIWILVSTNGSLSTSALATAVNSMIGGAAYTSASFHSRTSADNATAPGTGADDA